MSPIGALTGDAIAIKLYCVLVEAILLLSLVSDMCFLPCGLPEPSGGRIALLGGGCGENNCFVYLILALLQKLGFYRTHIIFYITITRRDDKNIICKNIT